MGDNPGRCSRIAVYLDPDMYRQDGLVKELIEFITKKLVEHPDDVQVRVIEGDEGQTYELRVHPDDMGRVIGKNGRVAKAVRTLLNSASAKQNIRAILDIVE